MVGNALLITAALRERTINISYQYIDQDKIRGSNPLVLKKMRWNPNRLGEVISESKFQVDTLHMMSLMIC